MVCGKNCFMLIFAFCAFQPAEQKSTKDRKFPRKADFFPRRRMVTETVYGFLDFTTTVGSKVMVFTPQSEIGVIKPISTKPTISKSIVFITPILTKVTVRPTVVKSATTSTRPTTGLARLLQEAAQNKPAIARPPRQSAKNKLIKNKILKSFKLKKSKNSPIIVEGVVLQPSKTTELSGVESFNSVPTLKVLSPLQTKLINSKLENNLLQRINELPKTSKRTGLITTLGGTKITSGQTTIHKTSVIGTYINGKYAQVLESTSRLFKANPADNLIPASNILVHTVKSVIHGSSVHFMQPLKTAAPKLDSKSATPRNLRYKVKDSILSKRRGSNYYRDDYNYNYYDTKDHGNYDEYEDLVRSGSGIRSSFQTPERKEKISTPSLPLRRPVEKTFIRNFRPGATRNTPPSFLRNGSKKSRITNRYKLKFNKPKVKLAVKSVEYNSPTHKNDLKTPQKLNSDKEVTLRVVTRRPLQGPTNVWHEIATVRAPHLFTLNGDKSVRYTTYTKTFTRSTTARPVMKTASSDNSVAAVYQPALFEQGLKDKNVEIATLPQINLGNRNINEVLGTTTERFSTVETMYKTSVLPVKYITEMKYHTLIQTYFITRIVSAIKTMPPVEAFRFIPGESLNEFNSNLLAEGSENDDSLLPGEKEFNENEETRVAPPLGFGTNNLAEIASGKFNPEVLEEKLNPQFAAAVNGAGKSTQSPKNSQIGAESPQAQATPALSSQDLQMAYLRLLNPYMFAGLPGAQNGPIVTSKPVVKTTVLTTVASRVLRVIFNAKPMYTTILSTGVVTTTVTSYETSTVAPQNSLPGLGFPFPMQFGAG